MKHNRKHQLFGWLSASALLLTTACTSVADLDVAQVDNHDKNVVTLTVRPQSLASGMRDASEGEGDIDFDTQNQYIGRGLNIDVLIYTVYEQSEDGTLTPTDNSDLIKGSQVTGFTAGDGQSVIRVSWNENNSCKVRLVLDPDKKYQVAFWAQSEKAKDVFDAQDLKKVQVKYVNAKNNDELRDAFCAVSGVIDGSVIENVVTLRRPFAQINVGTTGADYKNIVIGKQVYPNRKVTQSKIKLYGVAQYYNVVESKSLTATEVADATTDAEFTYDIIPAFINMESVPTEDAALYGMSKDEEFLKVDLDNDGKFAAYKINYPTLSRKGRYLTETFKYLSMCYALAPTEAGGGATLSQVEVSFAETEINEDEEEYTPITLRNVPVQRNYRTNILGGLKWMKDPTNPDDPGYPDQPDPNDPDDPDNPDNPDDPDNPGPVYPDPDDPYDPENPDPDDPYDPDDPDSPDDPNTPPGGPDDPSSVFGLVNVQIIQQPFYYDEDNEDLGEPADNGEYDLSKDGPSEEEEPEVDKTE